jgi:alpha-L-rhamnosidase
MPSAACWAMVLQSRQVLGEGYGTPKVSLPASYCYADGSEEVVVSDPTWKAIQKSHSDEYGLLRVRQLRCHVSNSRAGMQALALMIPTGSWQWKGRLPESWWQHIRHHPDRVTEKTSSPGFHRKAWGGHYRVDFGVEISGWVRLNGVEGPRGTGPSGGNHAKMANLYSGDQQLHVPWRRAPRSYAPRFNWFVFSGVEIVNWPGRTEALNTLLAEVGQYLYRAHCPALKPPTNCSIRSIPYGDGARLDNMHGGIASDCPHRERSPYTGDGQVSLHDGAA